MQLIRGFSNLPKQLSACVATIGNFDGLHVGHQLLLRELEKLSIERQLPSVLITFEPYPQEFFNRDKPVARLMRLSEKWVQLAKTQLDYLLCVHFDAIFAGVTAEQFVQVYLLERLGMQAIVVGDDFHFGAKRAGDFQLLSQLAKQLHFTAKQMPTYLFANKRVSSTRIRQVLEKADFVLAEKLLGRPYTLIGKVAHGEKLGRKLGFPTANIHLHRQLVALSGIYVVMVHGIDGKPLAGVANIGTRPTVGGQKVLLEVYIFDFSDDIYGRNIEVEFLHKLRDEEYYETLQLMTEQIEKDVQQARKYLKNCN